MKNPFTIKFQASVLLAGQIILLLSSSVWDDISPDRHWPAWLYVSLFAAGGYALAGTRKWLFAYLLIASTGLVLSSFRENSFFEAVSTACFAIAYYMLFHAVIGHCFFRAKVTPADRIIGGIAGYILLGFLWSSQSHWAVMLNDDAFFNTRTNAPATDSEQLYFSFVTLTSLGYGEILPTTSLARLISTFSVLSGVLYLAIFISALMGVLVEKKRKD